MNDFNTLAASVPGFLWSEIGRPYVHNWAARRGSELGRNIRNYKNRFNRTKIKIPTYGNYTKGKMNPKYIRHLYHESVVIHNTRKYTQPNNNADDLEADRNKGCMPILANIVPEPLRPMRPESTDHTFVPIDVTGWIHTRLHGLIDNHPKCALDIKGIRFTIELKNGSHLDDHYVRMILYRFKDMAVTDDNNQNLGDDMDEFFVDPRDKCKSLDLGSKLMMDEWRDDEKIRMKLNKYKRAVYFDRVVKLDQEGETGNAVARTITNSNEQNKRTVRVNWFPKGGYRLRIQWDDEERKPRFQKSLRFVMFAQRKDLMGKYFSINDDYQVLNGFKAAMDCTHSELPFIDYRLKMTVFYKKTL